MSVIEQHAPPSAERRVSRAVLAVLVFAGIVTATLAFRGMLTEFRKVAQTPDLTVFGQVPHFTLTRETGRPLMLDGLIDYVWVADFIFTRCAGPCPRMTKRMAELQSVLGGLEDVRFVTFTVDPEYDTPEVLTRYGRSFGADFSTWTFLTGDRRRIYDLSINGFKLAVGESPDDEHFLLHSTKLVLVDRKGRIRGYYDGDEPGEVTQLVVDIQKLAAHGT